MRNILVFLGGIAAAVVVAVGLYQWLGGPSVSPVTSGPETNAPRAGATPEANAAAEVRAEDFVMGEDGAPVTVIEYASLTCPHCRTFHREVLPKLKSAYVDSGKVRLVYRDFPLDSAALQASMLARCAGRERFFGFLDVLFDRQPVWAAADQPTAALRRIAAQAGMSESQAAACLSDPRIEKQILEQRLEAEKAFNIDSTPSFIVNGRKVRGAATFERFKEVIDPLLAKAGN